MSYLYTRIGYLFYVLTLIVAFQISYRTTSNFKKWLVLISVLSLTTLYFGLRPRHVGYDTKNYYDYFYNLEWYWMEPGFTKLNRLIYNWIPNVSILFLAVNFWMSFNIMYFYYEETRNTTIAILLFIMFTVFPYGIQMHVNIIRQSLSLSLVFFSIAMWRKAGIKSLILRCILFSFLNVIAFSMHKSSIIFLTILILSYFLSNVIKWNLDVKHQLVLFSLVFIITLLNIPQKILFSIPIQSLQEKLIYFERPGSELRLLAKNILYLSLSVFSQYFVQKDAKCNNSFRYYHLVWYYNLLLIFSIVLSFSYTTSTRILAGLDLVLPLLLVYSLRLQVQNEARNLNIISLLLIIYTFLYSYSSGMRITFNW